MKQDAQTVEEIVEKFQRRFGNSAPRIAMRSPDDCDELAEWLQTTLTKVVEEARRECEIELRTKYIVVSKDVQAQHEQQIIEEARKEERERILNMIPSERRMVHHVIATGSQEDLNDTFRRGYNKCRNQVLEVLSDNK